MGGSTAPRRSVLPEGVEVREGKRGSSLRVTFYWNGVRRRETLDIPVTPQNIKYAGRLIGAVREEIERGTFNYADRFPNSKFAQTVAKTTRLKKATVGQLLDDYINTARKTGSLSPASIASYSRWTKARLAPQWGDTIAESLTTPELRNWIADLTTELAVKSVRNCVGVLSAVLSRAAADGVIKSNPLAPIKLKTLLPKRKKAGDDDKIEPFNDQEISEILAACDCPEEKAAIQFVFNTGIRIGEFIAIKWQHIDWRRNSIHIQDNIVSAEHGTVEKTTKTDDERDIPMLPGAREALMLMKPISSFSKGGYIFVHRKTKARWLDEHQFRLRWGIILRRAGVRYRNPYQMRHTFASKLLMNGEQELLVAKLLGHTTVEMVRRHYGRYINQPNGIVLKGDYSEYGTAPDLPHGKKLAS